METIKNIISKYHIFKKDSYQIGADSTIMKNSQDLKFVKNNKKEIINYLIYLEPIK